MPLGVENLQYVFRSVGGGQEVASADPVTV